MFYIEIQSNEIDFFIISCGVFKHPLNGLGHFHEIKGIQLHFCDMENSF